MTESFRNVLYLYFFSSCYYAAPYCTVWFIPHTTTFYFEIDIPLRPFFVIFIFRMFDIHSQYFNIIDTFKFTKYYLLYKIYFDKSVNIDKTIQGILSIYNTSFKIILLKPKLKLNEWTINLIFIFFCFC